MSSDGVEGGKFISIKCLSIGMGKYGGITAVPYEKPFLSIDGYVADIEIETFLKPNRSVSFCLKYAKYNKAELFFDEVKSKAFYFSASYNFSNPLALKNWFYEYSPSVALGREDIIWNDVLFSILSDSDPDSIKGDDKLNYLSIGFRGAIGYKFKNIVIKLSLLPSYDFLLYGRRRIIQDTQEGEKVYELNNPDYQSGFYLQSKVSVGVILF